MEENALKMVNKIFLEKNVLSILKRKAYSNAYLNSGSLYYDANELGKFRSRFFKSLLFYPFSFAPWISAVKSLIPPEIKGTAENQGHEVNGHDFGRTPKNVEEKQVCVSKWGLGRAPKEEFPFHGSYLCFLMVRSCMERINFS